ncbi:MAG: DedA family protein [Gammaproteobacteria bacterium]|nr:DedA family protein [Gammaproteobacteria bacterium]
MFRSLYDKVLGWARHRHAQYYLAMLSFAESSFFPIPPDTMLAPMVLAQPHKALRFALITTLFSVLGGIFGYILGFFAMEFIEPALHHLGYWEKYLTAQSWFEEWGVWVVFLAGFSPIPYKLFTICGGAMNMALAPFVLASAIGRGARFFMVALLIRLGGQRFETMLRKHIDLIGWVLVGACLILGLIIYYNP